jgi:hypothetical protein
LIRLRWICGIPILPPSGNMYRGPKKKIVFDRYHVSLVLCGREPARALGRPFDCMSEASLSTVVFLGDLFAAGAGD